MRATLAIVRVTFRQTLRLRRAIGLLLLSGVIVSETRAFFERQKALRADH